MISIIIPLYNKERYIEDCVHSITSQGFSSYEIVIVNDGSTDASLSIAQKLSQGNPSIRVIDKPNGGVSSARNCGVKAAKGDWVLLLDADDTLLPDSLSIFSKYCSPSSYKVIIANYFTVFGDHKIQNSKLKQEQILNNPLKYIWYRRLYSRPGNTLIHKSVFDLIGGYDEDLAYNEDYEFSLRLLSVFKALYIPNCVMNYTDCATGASSRVHPYEKDFVSKIGQFAFNSIWQKLIMYNLLKWDNSRRTDEKKAISQSEMNNFGRYFPVVYFISLGLRKIFS